MDEFDREGFWLIHVEHRLRALHRRRTASMLDTDVVHEADRLSQRLRTGNEWVRICHSVMSGIAPQCPIVGLSHLIRPLEVASGALLLADSVPYIPENAVSLAVVDPTVGKDREIAIESASGRAFVGPDNGLCPSRGKRPEASRRLSSSRLAM